MQIEAATGNISYCPFRLTTIQNDRMSCFNSRISLNEAQSCSSLRGAHFLKYLFGLKLRVDFTKLAFTTSTKARGDINATLPTFGITGPKHINIKL